MPNVNDGINVDNYKFGGLMKKLVLYILMIALLIAGCGGEKQSASNKLQVAASFYPMAEFARNVGGAGNGRGQAGSAKRSRAVGTD